MNSSDNNFNIVGFVENLTKSKYLISINAFIFLIITLISISLMNNKYSSISYTIEISESNRFNYRLGNNFSELFEKLFINEESILFDTIANFQNSNVLRKFIEIYSDKSGKNLSIDDRDNLLKVYSSLIDLSYDQERNKYTFSLNLKKSLNDKFLVNNDEFFIAYVEHVIDNSLLGLIKVISERLIFLDQTYNSDLKIENERINEITKSYSQLTKKLEDDNRLNIEKRKRVLTYQIEVARAKESAIKKIMENKIVSNIKIAKRLGYAKPLTSESINSAVYGDASQNIFPPLGNTLNHKFPLYVFGYELLEEELDHIIKTDINDALSIKNLIIELENISFTDDIAFVPTIEGYANSLNDDLENSINYLATLKKDYDSEYEITNRLLNYLNKISENNNSDNRNLIVNFNKNDLQKELRNLNFLEFSVLSILISIVFSCSIIYYQLEKKNLKLIKSNNY